MKKKAKPMDDNTVRVIKIGQEALLEFIYETFIGNREDYFDYDSKHNESCPCYWAIDWEKREFIFCVHNGGNGDLPLSLPKEVDLETVMKHISDTTNSVLCPDRYREYSVNELIELSKKED